MSSVAEREAAATGMVPGARVRMLTLGREGKVVASDPGDEWAKKGYVRVHWDDGRGPSGGRGAITDPTSLEVVR